MQDKGAVSLNVRHRQTVRTQCGSASLSKGDGGSLWWIWQASWSHTQPRVSWGEKPGKWRKPKCGCLWTWTHSDTQSPVNQRFGQQLVGGRARSENRLSSCSEITNHWSFQHRIVSLPGWILFNLEDLVLKMCTAAQSAIHHGVWFSCISMHDCENEQVIQYRWSNTDHVYNTSQHGETISPRHRFKPRARFICGAVHVSKTIDRCCFITPIKATSDSLHCICCTE